MLRNILHEIHAVVSIFNNLSMADDVLSEEEVEITVLSVLHFFPNVGVETLALNKLIQDFLRDPLPLDESLKVLKGSSNLLKSSLLLQSALVIASDGKVDLFEEVLLKVVSTELFGESQDKATHELIADMKTRLEFSEMWDPNLWANRELPDELKDPPSE